MKKEIWKKCIRIAAVAFLATVMVLNVITAVLSKQDLRKQLNWMPYAALSVQGGSMDPEMTNGDLIIVNKCPYESLQIGDDVTFFTELGFVTHRIVAVQDGAFVTKGLSNETDDIYTMGAEEYCGKVVAAVPLLGFAFQLLSGSYAAMVVCVLAILLICFGGPTVRKLKSVARQTEQKGKSDSSMPTRALACATLLSMLLCMPYVTDTKYIGQVNRFEMAVARPLYFSSNYLAEGAGNQYSILGWNGKSYVFNLQIRNYDNELLFNRDDIDVRYGIGIKKITDGYSADYDVDITPDSKELAALTDFDYPKRWENDITPVQAYQIDGGAKTTQFFNIKVTPTTTLSEGTKIHFKLYATVEEGKDYAIELLGSFELTVAASVGFIASQDVSVLDSIITMNVKTNVINDGANEKIVLFSWDPQSVYINEYQSTAFNIINKDTDGKYYDPDRGYLWMHVQAFSNINLEFFKRNLDTDSDGIPDLEPNYNITATVVKGVGSTEPGEAEETPPAEP